MSHNLDDINKSPSCRAFEASMNIIDSEWNRRLQPEPEPLEEEYEEEYPCFNECYISINHYDQCGVESKRRYFCSRIKGHEGQHVACGVEHAIEVWDDIKEDL